MVKRHDVRRIQRNNDPSWQQRQQEGAGQEGQSCLSRQHKRRCRKDKHGHRQQKENENQATIYPIEVKKDEEAAINSVVRSDKNPPEKTKNQKDIKTSLSSKDKDISNDIKVETNGINAH